MSTYCILKVLTPNNERPTVIEKYFEDKSIIHLSENPEKDLMYRLGIDELSLCEIMGSLRAIERNEYAKVFIEYGVYLDSVVEGVWLDRLPLPTLKNWEIHAIHTKRLNMVDIIINRA